MTRPPAADFNDRGDAARRAAGIDGTAGDAQDIPHALVPGDPHPWCLLCGLAPAHRKHETAEPRPQAGPHPWERHGWRWWLCRHCYAPRSLHPRAGWVAARPLSDHRYLGPSAPHFSEGW